MSFPWVHMNMDERTPKLPSIGRPLHADHVPSHHHFSLSSKIAGGPAYTHFTESTSSLLFLIAKAYLKTRQGPVITASVRSQKSTTTAVSCACHRRMRIEISYRLSSALSGLPPSSAQRNRWMRDAMDEKNWR